MESIRFNREGGGGGGGGGNFFGMCPIAVGNKKLDKTTLRYILGITDEVFKKRSIWLAFRMMGLC